ncbi:predicted protein [Lichtheimia corymbifera JMRC:FSU:9682]|uniref:Uncharacterized protein n=1 Tax=Lichtheimia corymbifera JMRC:FSU:9682 TaxID=1263082 RepID=A0A068RPT6_9FUNG|nr:predicted protein [Lichtheimia corymbifera JMRC:FSU:9682]
MLRSEHRREIRPIKERIVFFVMPLDKLELQFALSSFSIRKERAFETTLYNKGRGIAESTISHTSTYDHHHYQPLPTTTTSNNSQQQQQQPAKEYEQLSAWDTIIST